MSKLYHDRVNTPSGVFLIIFNSEGLFELLFPGRVPAKPPPQRPLPWSGLADDLNRYLEGLKVDFSVYPLDCSGYRPFTDTLLKEVSRIPYGRVCTYRETAERAGFPRAWRAAGQALKANRHPIVVPCHRVVGSGGKLGGFSGPPGWKLMLLELERS